MFVDHFPRNRNGVLQMHELTHPQQNPRKLSSYPPFMKADTEAQFPNLFKVTQLEVWAPGRFDRGSQV